MCSILQLYSVIIEDLFLLLIHGRKIIGDRALAREQLHHGLLLRLRVVYQSKLISFKHIVTEAGLLLLKLSRRRHHRVNADLQSIFDHWRDDLSQEGAGQLQAGVVVDFDQPRVEVSVNHEIHPEDLEVVALLLGVDHHRAGPDRIGSNLPHPGVDLLIEVVPPTVLPVQVLLKIFIADLVAFLVLAVLRQVLLDGVVSEVDRSHPVLDSILEGSSPDVAQLVPVPLDGTVDACNHHVVADVELAALVQKRLLYVRLDDVSLQVPVVMPLLSLKDSLDLLQVHADCYAITPIGELTRLHNPHILGRHPRRTVRLLHLQCLFAGGGLLVPLPGPYPLGALVVTVQELQVLGVLQAILHVEGQGQVLENILFVELVIAGHGVEQGFFVADDVVVEEVVVHFEGFQVDVGQLFALVTQAGAEKPASFPHSFLQMVLNFAILAKILIPMAQLMAIENFQVKFLCFLELSFGQLLRTRGQMLLDYGWL